MLIADSIVTLDNKVIYYYKLYVKNVDMSSYKIVNNLPKV
jgi:hypothetical protein